jgi:hypothetical protein
MRHFHDTKYFMKEGDKRAEVQSVTEEKDLGVYYTSNLKTENNVSNLLQKQDQS